MTDSNDIQASAVQALLLRLRASQAWHETIGTSTPAAANPSRDSGASEVPESALPLEVTTPDSVNEQDYADPATSARPSVASLLSQLQSSSAIQALVAESTTTEDPPAGYDIAHALQPSAQPTDPRPRRRTDSDSAACKQDLRNASFQQALPIIAQLSGDRAFVDAIRTLKNDQVLLEKRLWDERQSIQKRHEEKVKIAKTKASMIGVSLAKFEADSMTDAFRRELQQFDRERVLPAWDGLITKQQQTLESLGVPSMFPTEDSTERQKQQRVIQVVSEVAE